MVLEQWWSRRRKSSDVLQCSKTDLLPALAFDGREKRTQFISRGSIFLLDLVCLCGNNVDATTTGIISVRTIRNACEESTNACKTPGVVCFSTRLRRIFQNIKKTRAVVVAMTQLHCSPTDGRSRYVDNILLSIVDYNRRLFYMYHHDHPRRFACGGGLVVRKDRYEVTTRNMHPVDTRAADGV